MDTTPARVRNGTWSRAAHCSSMVSSSTSTRSPVAAISASSAFASVVLPLLVAPAIRMFWRSRTAQRRKSAWPVVRMPSADVAIQADDAHGALAQREGRARRGRRQDALEALAGFGQLGGQQRLGRDALPRRRARPTRRMMRSPSASDSSTPSGARPDDSRSTHRVRSGSA